MYFIVLVSVEDSYVFMGFQVIVFGFGIYCSFDEYIVMSLGSILSLLFELFVNLEFFLVNRDFKFQRKRKLFDQVFGVEEGSKVLEVCGKVFFLIFFGKELFQRVGKYKGKEKWLVLNGKG